MRPKQEQRKSSSSSNSGTPVTLPILTTEAALP